MSYHLFVNNATFSWRATLSQIAALSTTEAELKALASCCCGLVWAPVGSCGLVWARVGSRRLVWARVGS